MARIMFHVPKIAFIYFMSFILCSNSIAQKHTFTKNEGEFYSYNTKETIKSKDIDSITIENLGKGLYKFSDSKEAKIFRYSHTDRGVHIYLNIAGLGAIKCMQPLSSFALGKPGKIIIEIQGYSFELRYLLGN